MIYADYQAATPVDPRVIELMTVAMQELFANPHSQDHLLGWKAKQAIDSAAHLVADMIGAEREEIIFTSGASEANTMAVAMASFVRERSHRDTIVISKGDHNSLRHAAHCSGLEVVEIPLDSNGAPDIVECRHLSSKRTAMISVVGVNNENGAVANLKAIGEIAADCGAIFHADLAQAPLACKISMDQVGLGCATLSSHKLYGPKGIGVFVVAHSLRDLVRPIIPGAGQQNGKRGGTIPTELCIGFGEACRIVTETFADEGLRTRRVRDQFVEAIEHSGRCALVGSQTSRHPGNALIHFPGIAAADLMARIQHIVAASTQAACSTGSIEPSHVLRAMGFDRERASECIRFSFGRFSNYEQAMSIVCAVEEALAEIDRLDQNAN